MSFNLNESSTCINIKLTDAGRRQLSLGRLKFAKVVFSDREIDYGVDRSGIYDITSNRILSPADAHPDIDLVNLDGTQPWTLTNQNITAAKIFTTGTTDTDQFFSTNLFFNDNIRIDRSFLTYNSQTFDSSTVVFGTSLNINNGDLVWIPWLPPQTPGSSYMSSFPPFINASGPPIGLWYRVISGSSSTTFLLDRPLPRFTTVAKTTVAVVYPFNGIENYYGSGATQSTSLWNMNITRTMPIPGTIYSGGTVSGHTRYGSLEYSGTKLYFGFGNETPSVGFIHHTNMFSGSSTGEQLIEKSVKVYMPMLLWHNHNGLNGKDFAFGQNFYDKGGDTIYDNVAKSTYRYLCDNEIFSAATIVGRVYHKLKIIVITDQELLTALSYKSNRNYTYPEPIVSLGPTPAFTLNSNQTTGLCKSGYTYFVTYIPESDSYNASTSFGLPDALHCAYVKKIEGENDINGNPKYLNVTFPPNSFPYMRGDSLISSGAGWNANYVQILVNEQPSGYNYDVANVPSDGWRRVSTRAAGGNGVYKATTYGDGTIDPDKLNNYRFVISQQDFTSGSTYVLYSGLTINQDVLNFGDEHMFFGIVQTDFLRATYKSIISVYATDSHFMESQNSTFDWTQDEYVYVSELALLDDKDQVVAVGKPTYPLKKEPNRFLTFQLQVDF